MIRFRTSHEEETKQLGSEIGALLLRPSAVLLIGELGSGKTVLARGIFQGLGVDPSLVRSPSFSLVNEYPSAQGPVFHIDLYRLDKASDFESIPLEEMLTRTTITVVEWADKLPFAVAHSIQIEVTAEDSSRSFQIDPEIPGLHEITLDHLREADL